jgi:hypothetical protein
MWKGAWGPSGVMGIFLCPNGVWAHRCTSSNRKLSICAFHQMQILPPEERNRTINKYGTLINNVCAEVFREVYWCLQPILKLIFFFAVVGLELRASTLTQSANPFLWRVFWDRVSWNYLPGWLWTSIILISASWVARMTGMSHRCLTAFLILKSYSPYPFCREVELADSYQWDYPLEPTSPCRWTSRKPQELSSAEG